MKNTRKGASSPGWRVGHLASTVSVTGFSVAQTGKSVALTVGTKCGFGPAERVFGVYLEGEGASRFGPRNSRFQTSVQCHTTTILFGDDNQNNKNNILCCISCSCCRLKNKHDNQNNGDNYLCCTSCSSCRPKIITRQPKQQGQLSWSYKLSWYNNYCTLV